MADNDCPICGAYRDARQAEFDGMHKLVKAQAVRLAEAEREARSIWSALRYAFSPDDPRLAIARKDFDRLFAAFNTTTQETDPCA